MDAVAERHDPEGYAKRQIEIEAQAERNAKHRRELNEFFERAFGRPEANNEPSWVAGYDKLDELLQNAERRFYEALRHLERHTLGFGRALQENLKVIEAEVLDETKSATKRPSTTEQNEQKRNSNQHSPGGSQWFRNGNSKPI